MNKYAVVYWKNLRKDKVTIKEFSDEVEMVEFSESKKTSGYGVLVAEVSHYAISKEKTYKLHHYGAYLVFKYMAIYFGIILIFLFFVIVLILKGKGI